MLYQIVLNKTQLVSIHIYFELGHIVFDIVLLLMRSNLHLFGVKILHRPLGALVV